jgi:hypothetical protein
MAVDSSYAVAKGDRFGFIAQVIPELLAVQCRRSMENAAVNPVMEPSGL